MLALKIMSAVIIHNNAKSNKSRRPNVVSKHQHILNSEGASDFWMAHNKNCRPGVGPSPENENEEIVNSGRKRGPLINVKKGF